VCHADGVFALPLVNDELISRLDPEKTGILEAA
jgi:hypothetical protein